MTDRSGCGLAELTLLQAVAALSGGRKEAASAKVLDEVDRRIGLGPSYAYPMVCDLTKQWVIPVPFLVSGDAGDRVFPWPAEPVHSECRLSRAGELVVAAEAGTIAAVPAGLINGTWWRGAALPPLDPFGVITAMRHLIDDPGLPDSELLQIAGAPISTTHSELTGDFEALARGQQTTIREAVRITRTDTPVPPAPAGPRRKRGPVKLTGIAGPRPRPPAHLIIDSVPRQISETDINEEIRKPIRPENWDPPYPPAGTPPQIGEMRDRLAASVLPIAHTYSDSRKAYIRVEIRLRPGSDPQRVLAQLARMDGLAVDLAAEFPAPLAGLLRSWTDDHRHEDITTSLDQLEAAIRADQLDQRDYWI